MTHDSPTTATPSELPSSAHHAPTSLALRRRLLATAASLSGIAFAAFPLLRPWGDKTGDPLAMARAFADPLWVAAHASGMLGWVLLVASAVLTAQVLAAQVLAPRAQTARSDAGPVAGRRLAFAAAWFIGAGVAGILPYYGSEAFSLHSLGRTVLATGDTDLVGMETLIRSETVAMTLFGLGLLATAIGAVLLAVAARTARHSAGSAGSSWAAAPVAVLVCLYLPQFFAPDPIRIAHGLLLGAACVIWGLSALRQPPARS